jgi:hypothetical protein
MATDSTALGYLAPTNSPDYDVELEDIFQGACVGISGLAGDKVRPKWQPNPPNAPDQNINWASVGVAISDRQWDAYQSHDPNAAAGAGESTLETTETLEVTFSFFGPQSMANATRMRDGMSITQNRDVLGNARIKFVEFREPVNVPSLLKDTWQRRVDLKGTFTRAVTRTYSVRHFASASGTIDNERYITPWSVSPPSP